MTKWEFKLDYWLDTETHRGRYSLQTLFFKFSGAKESVLYLYYLGA